MVTFTRSNPSHDIYGINTFTEHKHWGCAGPLIIDARIKPHHAPVLEKDPEVEKLVDRMGEKGGSLFGLFNWRFIAFIFALILLILGRIIKATEWLNNMPKKKNCYWSKIEIISLKFQFNEILKIYDIGGFTYSLDVYEKFQLSIAENELKSFLEKSTWDGSKDLIELYLVEFKDNDSKIVVLFSPIELYANDEVCGILDTNDLVTDISKEKIFPESKIITA